MSRAVAVAAIVLLVLVAGRVGAQSLEEQARRPPGTNSLGDDSERLKGGAPDGTDSLDDDSMEQRGRTADQGGTNSLDDGSLQGGDRPDADWPAAPSDDQ